MIKKKAVKSKKVVARPARKTVTEKKSSKATVKKVAKPLSVSNRILTALGFKNAKTKKKSSKK